MVKNGALVYLLTACRMVSMAALRSAGRANLTITNDNYKEKSNVFVQVECFV